MTTPAPVAPPAPVLIACSHGTASAGARAAMTDLARAAADLLNVEYAEAFVDVQEPRLADVLAGLPASDSIAAVVVPIFLASGYHVNVDVARAAAARTDVTVARTVGPDPIVTAIVLDRLRAAGAQDDDAVVFASAGTSDAGAAAQVGAACAALASAWRGAVTAGFAAAGRPTVADAVTAARADGASRVVIASYLLAPGVFHARLDEAGADAVAAPLVPDPRLSALVAARYRESLAARSHDAPT